MKYLTLNVPGYANITSPAGVPQGGTTDVNTILSVGIQLTLTFTGLLSLWFIVMGGIKWMTSEGDKEKLAAAQKTILFATGGLILTLLSFLVMTTLGTFFGINFLSLNIPQ